MAKVLRTAGLLVVSVLAGAGAAWAEGPAEAYAPLKVVGLLPETGQALIFDEASAEYRVTRVGDTLEGWQIVEIVPAERRVTVVQDGMRDDLALTRLPRPGSLVTYATRSPAAAPAPAAPAASAAPGAVPSAAAPAAAAKRRAVRPATGTVVTPPPVAGASIAAPPAAADSEEQSADEAAPSAAPPPAPAPARTHRRGAPVQEPAAPPAPEAGQPVDDPYAPVAVPPPPAARVRATAPGQRPAAPPAPEATPPAAADDEEHDNSFDEAPGPQPVDPYAASEEPRAAPAPRQPAAAPRAAQPERLFERHFLRQGELDRELNDFDRLVATVRVAPAAGGGFVITFLDPSSWTASLGLRQGDVVRTIGGEAVSSIDDAARVYGRLRTLGTFVVEVARGPRQVVLRYDVR